MEANTNKKEFSLKNIKMKNIIKGFTLLWGLILIVIMSLVNVGINKDAGTKEWWINWLSNSLIIFGIIVFGLLMGESIGTDKQKEAKNGFFQASYLEYNEFYKKITDIIIYFYQWFQWFMPKELRDKKINYLIAKGVDINKAIAIVDNCVLADLRELKEHPIKRNDVFIRQLNEYEIEPVEEILSGSVKLNLSQPNYYLTAFGNENTGSILEEGKEIAKLRARSRRNKRAIKILSTLFVSLAWGLLTWKEFADGNKTQAWFNLISRITALCTSFASGWGSATVDVKLQAQTLVNKHRVLKLFKDSYDKKLFETLNEQELAEKEYTNYEKELEEAKKNVIEPEVIPQLENNGSLIE